MLPFARSIPALHTHGELLTKTRNYIFKEKPIMAHRLKIDPEISIPCPGCSRKVKFRTSQTQPRKKCICGAEVVCTNPQETRKAIKDLNKAFDNIFK